MEQLLKTLDTISPMSPIEVNEIAPLLVMKKVNKNDFILRSGQKCDFFVYVNYGAIRTFSIGKNGENHNIMLNAENEFLGNLESYVTNQPSNVSIQAIEPSEIIMIFKKDLDKLYESSLYWNKFGRTLTENVFIESKNRLEFLLYNTPEERYINLLNSNPTFLVRYPLTDIASFLGITPQSLSRIRSRINVAF